jgi:WD40 repeat protein
VPETATTIGVFDYVTNTWANYAKPTASTIGACLLPDGRALLVPGAATAIATFDYRTNTTTEVVTGLSAASGKYYAATLLPDGRVFIPSRLSTENSLLFDYKTNSIQTLDSGIQVAQTATLLPDGRVFCHWSSNTLRTFNYLDNSLTTHSSPNLGTVLSSALMPDGRVLFAAGRNVGSFDYRSSTSVQEASYGSTGDSISTLSVLPDGRVLAALLAAGSGTFGAFDYRTNTWTTYLGTGSAYWGAVLLPDGRTMLVPRNVAHVAVVSIAGITRAPSIDFCYHPCFNQGL